MQMLGSRQGMGGGAGGGYEDSGYGGGNDGGYDAPRLPSAARPPRPLPWPAPRHRHPVRPPHRCSKPRAQTRGLTTWMTIFRSDLGS
ncbi:hypothetical protein SDC9_171904 [bioreactor metagenome]|uniref:Uncharacterized protein n=1 Tax=bioreactor metagenome TaxID=1076179 RepID=A0A645GCU7_9ZZZZ